MDPWLTGHAVVMVALFLLPALTLAVTYLRYPDNESMRVNVAWAFVLGLGVLVPGCRTSPSRDGGPPATEPPAPETPAASRAFRRSAPGIGPPGNALA